MLLYYPPHCCGLLFVVASHLPRITSLFGKGPNMSSHLGSRVSSSAGSFLEGLHWEGRG